MRTSHPDFRVSMIVVYKKFFFRLRAVFENEFIYENEKYNDSKKKNKKASSFTKLEEFITSLFQIMKNYIYPGNKLIIYQ